MTETPEPAPAASPPPRGFAIAAITVAALLAAVLALAWMNREFKIALDRDGKFNISVAAGANLRDILVAALASDRGSVDEILAARDYYHFTDPDLANALEGLNTAEPTHAAAIAGLRQLLRDQRGPFVMPDTLLGFDAKLIDAFGSLEAKLEETKETSDLLIGLWRQSLDYQGIFRTRMFEATVRRYPTVAGRDTPVVVVYGCPGSDFSGKEVMLRTSDLLNSISGVIVSSEMHRCNERDQKLAGLFSGGQADFGLDADTYAKLFSPADPAAPLAPEMRARFQFLPQGQTTLSAKLGG